MPKFDASSVGDVEYDFTGFKGVKGSTFEGVSIDSKGVVPEPSRHLMGDVMKRMSQAFKKVDPETEVGETPEAVAEALSKVEDIDTFELMAEDLLGSVTDICDGSPNREALEALGWRRFMAFFGYVMKELMSPEAAAGDSKDTPIRLRSV